MEFNRVNGEVSSISTILSCSHCYTISLGNLALSRALGDFVYKRDANRGQDEQIVIGNLCIT